MSRPAARKAQGSPDRHLRESSHPLVYHSASSSHSRGRPRVPEIVQNTADPESPEVEDNVRVPHIQSEGRKAWEQFDGHAEALDHHLFKFREAVQELGSSVNLAQSARDFSKNLCLTAWLFRENARNLFPLAIDPALPPHADYQYRRSLSRPRSWPPTPGPPPDTIPKLETSLDVELSRMAAIVERFVKDLEQFPGFDTNGSWYLRCFEGDLKYWSSCLQRYQGQLESHEVQIYIHDLSRELGDSFDEASRRIREYIDAVPTVRLSQKHTMSNLQNLTAVATFFSAVTATTLQYSFAKNDTAASRTVNLFWFSSLVLSIASALNSFLVVTWRGAVYSPLHIPWWLHIWIHHCPPVFLLMSVVAFLAGLGCFVVSSQQATFTWIVVLIFEGISSFGLAALLVWLAADKWSFYRLQRQRQVPTFRLTQIFGEKPASVLPTYIEHTASWSSAHLVRLTNALAALTSSLGFLTSKLTLRRDTHYSAGQPPKTPSRLRPKFAKRVVPIIAAIRIGWEKKDELEQEYKDTADRRQAHLRNLTSIGSLKHHEVGAAVSGVQFDPKGDSIVICGKRLSIHHRLGSLESQELRHRIGQARQIVWSSSGNYILTRTNRAIHVWRWPDRYHRMIRRYETTSFILGLSTPEESLDKFISIEGRDRNKLAVFNVLGEEEQMHEFDDIYIQHLDAIPGSTRVLLVATSPQTAEGTKPLTASPVRKLIVYNLEDGEMEHDVPLWHNVQHVAVSKNGQMAVVTYKSYPPPQLWTLHSTSAGTRITLKRQFCARERVSALEFDPTRHIQFTGKAQFLDNDNFITCTTTEGKLHFWRRDKSDPVRVLNGTTQGKDKIVHIECNRASNDFMFATRSQDGTINLWKEVPDPTPSIIPPGPTEPSKLGSFEEQGLRKDALTESPQSELPEANCLSGG